MTSNKLATLFVVASNLLFVSSLVDTNYTWAYNEDECPNGTEVPFEECLLALQSLTIGFDNITAQNHLRVGDWNYTPCGCFFHNGKGYSSYDFDNGPLQGDTGCIGRTPVNGESSTLICKSKTLHTDVRGINNWSDANGYCMRQGGGPCGSWCTQSSDVGIGCGSNEGHLCCPLEFPYQGKDIPDICYNSTDSANASTGPCGSWCTNNINLGSNCSGSNAERMCARTYVCPIEFPYQDQLVSQICHNIDVNANGGQRLATRAEWCPDGITPFRGIKQGMDQWAAISDGENNWVQVGNIEPDRTCKANFEVALDDPTWGLNNSQYFESNFILCVSSNIRLNVSGSDPLTNPSSTPTKTPFNIPSVIPTTKPSLSLSTLPSATSSFSPSDDFSALPSSVPSSVQITVPSSTSSPVQSTPPVVYCADSKFKFKTKDSDGSAIDKTCSWVSSKKEKRCEYDNVSTHCPGTCGTCELCSDSQAEFFFKNEYTTCAFTNEKKCNIANFFHTCRATCGTCPSLVPSTPPSSRPSTAPSALPSVNCTDSTFTFKTKDSDGNAAIDKTCSWVSSKKEKRCEYDNVSTHCPGTCGTCELCSDSQAEFLFKNQYTTCAFTKKKKCSITGFFHTCRATCGTCPSLVPSVPPSSRLSVSTPYTEPSTLPSVYCTDSIFRFRVKDSDGNVLKKSCIWVSVDKDTRCEYNNASTHCPGTCGTCEACTDSQVAFLFENEYTTCAIANKKKCSIEDFFHTCRATCGTCPSLVPSTPKMSTPSLNDPQSTEPSTAPDERSSTNKVVMPEYEDTNKLSDFLLSEFVAAIVGGVFTIVAAWMVMEHNNNKKANNDTNANATCKVDSVNKKCLKYMLRRNIQAPSRGNSITTESSSNSASSGDILCSSMSSGVTIWTDE